MTDLERLADTGSEEERMLLGAARHEHAPRAVRAKLLGSLVVASGVALTTSSASAGMLGIIKWLGAGVVAGTLVTGGATLLVEREQPARIAQGEPQPSPRATATAPPPVVKRETAPERPPERRPLAAVSKHQLPPAPAPAAADPRRLADEVASLDRARSALAFGDARKATRELERHRREFPQGVLAPEAEVLRIESALRAGERARAASLARRFLETNGRGPHASRVRSLLQEAETAVSAFPSSE